MSIEGKRRKAFETWFISHHLNGDISDEMELNYDSPEVAAAWLAWNAAIDSLCVDLPKKWDPRGGYCDYQYGKDQGIDDCRDAIHAAGVRTK